MHNSGLFSFPINQFHKPIKHLMPHITPMSQLILEPTISWLIGHPHTTRLKGRGYKIMDLESVNTETANNKNRSMVVKGRGSN